MIFGRTDDEERDVSVRATTKIVRRQQHRIVDLYDYHLIEALNPSRSSRHALLLEHHCQYAI